MLVTPLQLAQMAVASGTRGKRYRAAAGRRIRDPGTGKVREICRRLPRGDRGQGPDTWDVIIGGMVGVMNPPAAGSQRGVPYQIAGKTGTAQVFTVGQNEKYKAMERLSRAPARPCAGSSPFAPAEAPKIAVAVLVENGRSGSGRRRRSRAACSTAYLLRRRARRAAPPVRRPRRSRRPPAGETNDGRDALKPAGRAQRTFTSTGAHARRAAARRAAARRLGIWCASA